MTEEHRSKISESLKGNSNAKGTVREFSKESKQKMSESHKGSKHSDLTKEKISRAVSSKRRCY